MTVTDDSLDEVQVKEEITLESIAVRLDALGGQMNWLCENLAQLFTFVSAMGQNGGGIRGAMKMLKEMQGSQDG